jgi:hypothetical protein
MNFLKKGPEIKLSEIKVPDFVSDIYYDLKERHLLPLAAILLIAIVVVPFALGKSAEKQPVSSGGATATVGQEAGGSASGELVAKSAPGLRDYKRRLEHLKSKNPFRQQYRRGEPEEGASESGERSGSSSTTLEVSGSESESSTNSGGGSSENPTEYTLKHHLVYFSSAIDVKVSTGGGARSSKAGGTEAETVASSSEGKTQERHNLPELTMLPSRETPAVVFMGSTKDGKKALMLVSSDVTSIFGDATCVLGSATCQLLAMEEGLPETFVYGADNRTFKIEVTKIHLVESNKVHKAPLGKPHKHPEKG